jgi:hypothetical protein
MNENKIICMANRIVILILATVLVSCYNRKPESNTAVIRSDNSDATVKLDTCSILGVEDLFDLYNIRIKVEDFNSDGFIDTLGSYYSGGGLYGGASVRLKNGKNNEVFDVDAGDLCSCDIKDIIIVPELFRKKDNELFLEAVKKELLPPVKDKPESSLEWLISANLNHKYLKNNKSFDLVINVPPVWKKEQIDLPGTYCIEIKGDTFNLLYNNTLKYGHYNSTIRNNKKSRIKAKQAWLVYYAHNHYRNQTDSLLKMASNNVYQIFRTSHGVIVKKNDYYAWVFVTDYNLTGGLPKLREESIQKVTILNEDTFYNLAEKLALQNFGISNDQTLLENVAKIQKKLNRNSAISFNEQIIIEVKTDIIDESESMGIKVRYFIVDLKTGTVMRIKNKMIQAV